VRKVRNVRKVLVTIHIALLIAGIGLATAPAIFGQAEKPAPVSVLTVKGVINPVSSEYLVEGIADAHEKGYQAVIIEIDTPGGLDDSMRDIIKAMINTDIPIIVYVHPSGARAASAGAFITIAADIAVMTPGTNIGAASPVSIGEKMDDTMKAKVTNDSAAYITGLATNNNRNAELARRMVTEAISIPAEEALTENIINFIAKDRAQLIEMLDGKTIATHKGDVTLNLKGADIVESPMGFRFEFLYILSNPNIAYILMMLGIMGLYFELSNPGTILPGVLGGICLVLAFYSFQTLPVNYAGVLLILFAVLLFILEIKAPTHGFLAIGGVIALFFGSILLFDTNVEFLKVSIKVILPTVIGVALFFVFVVTLAVRAYRKKPTTGEEGIRGEIGVAKSRIDDQGGRVFVHGEWWDATSDEPIDEGAKVEVIESKNLSIKVRKL
jgi:membrane-bound serine protease (ClpP class)